MTDDLRGVRRYWVVCDTTPPEARFVTRVACRAAPRSGCCPTDWHVAGPRGGPAAMSPMTMAASGGRGPHTPGCRAGGDCAPEVEPEGLRSAPVELRRGRNDGDGDSALCAIRRNIKQPRHRPPTRARRDPTASTRADTCDLRMSAIAVAWAEQAAAPRDTRVLKRTLCWSS